MVVDENSDVSLRCATTGSPEPTITWKREDGADILLANGTKGIFFLPGESIIYTSIYKHALDVHYYTHC